MPTLRGPLAVVSMALIAAALPLVATAGSGSVAADAGSASGTAIGAHRPPDTPRTEALGAPTTAVVRFADGVDAATGAQALRDAGVTVYDELEHVFAGAVVGVDGAQATALAADPRIADVEVDRVNTLADTSSTDAGSEVLQGGATWGLDRIDQRNRPLNSSYEYAATGAGVTVYVLDSGVRSDQADFGGRAVAGAWLEPRYTGPGDCNGHGTHVAGIVGSNTYGVAKGATIFPVRVFDCAGSATASDVILGLNFVIGHHQAGQPAVLNLSIGGPISDAEDAAVRAVIDDGVTVTVAAGNDGASACARTPARVAEAITVAATDSADNSPAWSSTGACVDLFAPGVDITSLGIASTTATAVKSGTSMAAPFVAGVAALLLQQNPTWTPARVGAQLTANATAGVVGNARADSPNRLLFSLPVATSTLMSMTPARLVDTRPGSPTIDGQYAGIGLRGTGWVTEVQVAGRAGIAPTATTVSLNVTVTDAQAPGFVTVYPCGQPLPTASNLNYAAGDTIANAVVSQIGAGGFVCFYTYAPTHLIVDVNGFAPVGALYNATSPSRLLDTRPGAPTIDGQYAGIGQRGAGGLTELQVTGRSGVPATAVATSLNITVTDAQAPGFVTVYPCGQPLPTASNLNYDAGETIAAAVISRVGAGGKVCLYTYGPTQLVADLNGYYPAGSTYGALTPARLLDTRTRESTLDGQGAGLGVRGGGWITEVQVAGRAGVPADAATASLNVTVTETQATGFVTVYPCGEPVPTASNVNYRALETIANAVITRIGAGGKVCLFTYAPTQLVVDVNGYLPGA